MRRYIPEQLPETEREKARARALKRENARRFARFIERRREIHASLRGIVVA